MDNATRYTLLSLLQQHGLDAPVVLRECAEELEQLDAETGAVETYRGCPPRTRCPS